MTLSIASPFLLASLLAASPVALAVEAPASRHGAPITLTAPTRLADAIAAAGNGDASPRLFAGTIREVCRQKGCWLIFADPASPAVEPVRVTFADYAFFVPKDVAGRGVRLQGVIRQKKVSVKDAQHYAKDAGRPKGEIAAIREPQLTWTIEATGVEIR
jgi:hypothetical protein